MFAPVTRWVEIFKAVRHRETNSVSIEVRRNAAIEWLLRAFEATGRKGISAHYTIGVGWASGYPETTGYIIPTLIEEGQAAVARHCADWLLTVQRPSGGFPGGEIRLALEETVFNTGQIIRGLWAMFQHTKDPKYLESAVRAGTWLCSIAPSEGTWNKFTSPLTTTKEHTYDVLAAWGLLKLGRETNQEEFCEVALRQYRWTLSQQKTNGFFGQASFDADLPPLTHSLAYVLEGVFEIATLENDDRGIAAAKLMLLNLMEKYPSARQLPGRLDAQWNPQTRWACLTGDIQFGWMAVRFGKIISDSAMSTWGSELILSACETQKLHHPNSCLNGGLFGSQPMGGGYLPFTVINWGTKYLIDALGTLDQK